MNGSRAEGKRSKVEEARENLEEALRRRIVALMREAGTLIRKEELKRHALSAKVNLPYAESLRASLQADLNKWFESYRKIISTFFSLAEKKEPSLTEVLDLLLSLSEIGSLTTQFTNSLTNRINEVNNFLKSVVNRIIDDIAKEGVYLVRIEPALLPGQMDIKTLLSTAEETLRKLDMAIGVLRGIIEAAED